MNIKNTNLILSNYIKAMNGNSEVSQIVDAEGVVNFGKALSEMDFSDGMYKTDIGAGSIMDKIIRSDFYSAAASHTAPSVYKNADDWNTFTEVVRVDAGEYYKNLSYDGNGSGTNGAVTFEDIFGDYNPTVDAKYFNGLDTDEIRYTISEVKWNAAFKSENDFNRFVSEIHNSINTRREMRREMASYFTFASLIGGVAQDGTFNSSTGALTANSRLKTLATVTNNDYSAVVEQIRNTIRDMAEYSSAYTSGDYATATDKSVLTLSIDSDLYDNIKISLGDKFNTEMLELEKLGVKIDVRYKWALNNIGSTKNSIIIKTDNTPQGYDNVHVDNIQWALYHDYSAGCTRFNERAKTQPIPAQEKTNVFFKADYAYRVNLDFPCVLCTTNGLADVTFTATPSPSPSLL